MVLCYLCRTNIPTLVGFKLHLTMFHQNVKLIKCIENGCDRSFQIFWSFKRHYLSTHSLADSSANFSAVNVNNQRLDERAEIVKQSSSNSSIGTTPPSSSNNVSKPDIERHLAQFISKLYADPNLPRISVGMVVSGVKKLVEDAVVPTVQNFAAEAVSSGQMSEEIANNFTVNLTNEITSPFSKLNSERRRINYFKENDTYIPPQSIIIGQRFDSRKSGGVTRMESVDCTEQFIPLRQVLKGFFSLDNLLSETLQYMDSLFNQTDVIENFIQGSFWQGKKTQHCGRTVLPLFLYFDDYETGNVLGSHAGLHKLGAVYISVACLPPQRQSALSNIFLSLLFHSNDRSTFGNHVIFKPLIDELNFLSEIGVDIDLPSFKGTLYFEIGLIIGDNLGIHTITGFVESFSGNYPCRVCKVEKSVLRKQLYENETLLRNNTNYEDDLAINNPSLTGLKERCVWLDVKEFDLFQQVGVDIMHDVLEGVAKYVISFILVTLIDTFQFFTLEVLNDRITTFSYGPDLKNKPCTLEMNHLKNGNVRLSASEMLTLLRFFGLIVGEFVPKDFPVWKMYVNLRKILDLLLQTSIPKGIEGCLQTLVAELNEKYISMTKKNLTPKFHNLIHYHSLLTRFGPLIHVWSMRFEAKHRPSKISAKASCNRRNITLTLAMKHQLQLNDILSKGKLEDVTKVGPICYVTDVECNTIKSQLGLDSDKSLIRVKWVSVMSTRYEKDLVLAHSLDTDGYLVCYMIVNKVFLYDSQTIILSGLKLKTVSFDEHYFAYEVVPDDDVSPFFVFLKQLLSHVPNAKPFYINNKKYVVMRGPV